MYYDVKDSWMFDDDGDLLLTTDYGDNVKHRIMCPLHYLNIYYERYGSTLYQQLGERFDKEIIESELAIALEQDINVRKYTIRSIDFDGETLTIDMKVNEEDIIIRYDTIKEEVVENIIIQSVSIYINKLIVNYTIDDLNNEMEYSLYDMLSLDVSNPYTFHLVNYTFENNILDVELLVNNEKRTLSIDMTNYNGR